MKLKLIIDWQVPGNIQTVKRGSIKILDSLQYLFYGFCDRKKNFLFTKSILAGWVWLDLRKGVYWKVASLSVSWKTGEFNGVWLEVLVANFTSQIKSYFQLLYSKQKLIHVLLWESTKIPTLSKCYAENFGIKVI